VSDNYTPFDGESVEFKLGEYGVYDIPTGNGIAFKLSNSYSQVCEIFIPYVGDGICLDLSPITEISGDEIQFNFSQSCYPPTNGETSTDTGDTDDTEIVDTYVQPDDFSIKIGWKKASKVDGGVRCGWISYLARDRSISFDIPQAGSRVEISKRSPWGSTEKADPTGIICNAEQAKVANGDQLTSLWINLSGADLSAQKISWDKSPRKDTKFVAGWINTLNVMDFSADIPWGKLERNDTKFVAGWINSLNVTDFSYRTYWGKEIYEEICYRTYEPSAGNSLSFNIDTPIEKVDDGDDIRFYFDKMTYDMRCSQEEPSGCRDQYLYVYADTTTYPITPKYNVYIIMNSFSLIRTSDSKAVECSTINIKGDIDSWCWSFTATVPASALSLVSPVSDPVEVLATVNGYSWLLMVESWKENLSFNKSSYTISGRSTSAELAAPYAPIITGYYDEDKWNSALCEDQLDNTGWSVDWSNYDDHWTVTANALSYNSSSALKVVQSIAEAIGGRLQTDPTESVMTVVPRLHSLPWEWADATPDLAISDYVVKQLSREFLPGLSYDTVFVSGTNQGVLCKVTRDGYAGDDVAPMAVDALITETYPAQERGRMIIGRSGNWSRETLELPLTSSSELPGLLETGMLVSMTEGTESWRGQVTSVDISAGWQANRGVIVKQSVGVERYRGE
jgi:hypothetical protein